MDNLDRIMIAGRTFTLTAVFGLGVILGVPAVISTSLIVALTGITSVLVCLKIRRARLWAVASETLIVAVVLGASLPDSLILLPYLVVLALIAGVAHGLLGVALVVTGQATTLAVLLATSAPPFDGFGAALEAFGPWLLTSFGAGVLGAWLKQIGLGPRPVSDASYESARRLLTQLRTVARRLSAGLDPFGMSAQLLSVVHDHLQDSQSAVFVRGEGDVLNPLSYSGLGAREALTPDHPVIQECWTRMEPTNAVVTSGRSDRRRWTVLPLRVGSRMIGVVVSASGETPAPDSLKQLMRAVDEQAMRIDTALAFDEVRMLATSDERRRLAREIHDGIAQEVASIGYLVDDLAASTAHPEQARRLRDLREELTRLVSELRLSIFDLRTEARAGAGLGEALSDYVRQVGSRSNMTVHLTLDESATRLTAGVEAELLRIAQEAITNARKHSKASNLWVDCRVRPPFARLEISDDGLGLRTARDDSFGLRIMQERASRIGATLSVGDRPGLQEPAGTLVTFSVGQESSHPPSAVSVERSPR
ncbi:MAG: Two-component system sensor histidine kinase [uncultured Nocardioidaceae bacterium]|uniref:Two-component system sensor histidine kinase n=1 Tax=uncultured Nocardioidaceae bacterium TaxID=253824 RepID=A0A6J4LFA4_9ACTN|nr:MAG: Two-component system sensor histidine kinase [uncultured Nocardioidaceae bacterium]